ncbi:MAG: GNAT family N-acetyltransferase [Candidatus Heimdallarchaeota archaeon]|nr:GNAT family N-acetyltransferase [Candidatus Heimdallarchaeota archaeon]
MSEKIIFEDGKKFGFQIREMQKNQSDAQQLANCFNSWDDADSWPGGFGHGDPFTAERILDELEKITPLSKYVAISDGKIVGHCDILDHFTEEDIVYVGLLGVNPEYQGKKIGKNLLLQANNRAIELEKDEITLHTWGGNLKAVPLYKKIGYYWAPDSAVYMENFLPGILRRKLFKKYFDKFNWYDTYKRELNLLPDIEKIASMDVYTYLFEADEQNSLKIIIDIRAKKICGFELKAPEGTIGISCLVKNSIGFAGYNSVPVSWFLKNETNESKQFSLKTTTTTGLILVNEPEFIHTVNAGETKIIEAELIIDAFVETVTNPRDCHIRSKQLLKTSVLFDDQEIDLTVAQIPVDPLEINVAPELRSIFPGEDTFIPITLWNRTNSKMKTTMFISEIEDVEFETRNYSQTFEPDESIYLPIKIKVHKSYSKNIIPLMIKIYKEEKNKKTDLPDETIYVPVIANPFQSKPKCTGYIKKNKFAILENSTVRIKIQLDNDYAIKSITDKRDNQVYDNTFTGYIDLGMPFSGWANEFRRIKPDNKILTTEDAVSLILITKSHKKPGLTIERIFTIYANNDLIKITGKITNESTTIQKNIGLRLFSDTWNSFTNEGNAFLPINKGLLKVDDFLNFNRCRYFPKDPKEWKESWFCTELNDSKLIGTIWDNQFIKSVEPGLADFSNFEYHFGDLEPGQVKEASYLLSITRGSWKDFRTLWREIVKNDSSVKLDSSNEDYDIINTFTVTTESEIFGKRDLLRIQPFNSKDTLKLMLENNTLRSIAGKLRIELPKGITFSNNENLFEETISNLVKDKPYINQFKIEANEIYFGRVFPIKLSIIFEGDSIDLSFLAVIVNKETKITLLTETTETKKENITIDNSKLLLTASKDHSGAITSIKMPSITKLNNLLTSWPEVKPFIWASHWYGGITPYLGSFDDWSSINHKEKFTSETIDKGYEKGIRFVCTLQSEEAYKGLKLEIENTTLAYSNILKTTLRVTNSKNAYKQINCGITANIAVSEKVTNDIYFKQNNKIRKRTFHSNFFLQLKDDKWVVFVDDESKMAMAVIGPDKTNRCLTVIDQGELANQINTIDYLRIPPNGFIEYSILFILYPLNHELLSNLIRYY